MDDDSRCPLNQIYLQRMMTFANVLIIISNRVCGMTNTFPQVELIVVRRIVECFKKPV